MEDLPRIKAVSDGVSKRLNCTLGVPLPLEARRERWKRIDFTLT
jgi:hypothetical protein